MNNSKPSYPEGTKITRVPLYVGSFPPQFIAKVKQPAIKPTALSRSLELKPPGIHAGEETRNRVQKLERNDNIRTTWSLLDNEQHIEYSGSLEPTDPNNRYCLIYTNLDDVAAYTVDVKQLNLQKVNTNIRFKSLEEVEAFNKTRAKMVASIKPQDLGLSDDLESVKKQLEMDKAKRSKGKKGDSLMNEKRNRRRDDFDFDDGETVWAAADDDEGIQNRDLVDFEDSGDWLGGKKSDYAKDPKDVGNEDDLEDIQEKYGLDEESLRQQKKRQLRRAGGFDDDDSSSGDENDDYDDSDYDDNGMRDGTPQKMSGMVNNPAVKRKGLPLDDNDEDEVKSISKRQKQVSNKLKK